MAALGERLGHLIVDAQRQQVVAQQFADEELCGEVIQFPLSGRGAAPLAKLLGELEQHMVELAVAALGQFLAIFGLGDLLHPLFDVHIMISFLIRSCRPAGSRYGNVFRNVGRLWLRPVSTESIARFSLQVKGFLHKFIEDLRHFSGTTYEKQGEKLSHRHELPFFPFRAPDCSTRRAPPQAQR